MSSEGQTIREALERGYPQGKIAVADPKALDALAALEARLAEAERALDTAISALLRIRSQTTPGRAAGIAQDAVRALTCVCAETSTRNCPVHAPLAMPSESGTP